MLGSEVGAGRPYREGSAAAVGAGDSGVSPGLSQPLGTRRFDEDHERLQPRRPQHLDVLRRTARGRQRAPARFYTNHLSSKQTSTHTCTHTHTRTFIHIYQGEIDQQMFYSFLNTSSNPLLE